MRKVSSLPFFCVLDVCTIFARLDLGIVISVCALGMRGCLKSSWAVKLFDIPSRKAEWDAKISLRQDSWNGFSPDEESGRPLVLTELA